jgi:hypothetical protein
MAGRTMKRSLLALVALAVSLPARGADPALRERARAALRKAVEFYRTRVSTEGGYHFQYAEDLSYGRSEISEGGTRVEVQREGTPLVGMAYLDAYQATRDAYYLGARAARGSRREASARPTASSRCSRSRRWW